MTLLHWAGTIEGDTHLLSLTDETGKELGSCSVKRYGRGFWFLQDVEIVEAYRGLGFGSMLVERAVGYLSGLGAHVITLSVEPENEVAVRTFVGAGFSFIEGEDTCHGLVGMEKLV